MEHGDARAVADLFAESDGSELPNMIGVKRRTLFRFHGLYFHLVEAAQDITPNLYQVRSHPLYKKINEGLAQYMTPYDPAWQEPKDSMAEPFYVWQA
jgi:hypothetical protein